MASGFSRRLGSNKLLLPLEDRTVIDLVLEQIARVGYEPVVVVSQYDRILAMAEKLGFMPVPNPFASEGKSSSIRLGVSALEAYANQKKTSLPSGLIFFTGDQLLLSDQLLHELSATFLMNPDRIVFPVYEGEPGSPAIFPADMSARLHMLKGEEGGMKAAIEQKGRIDTVKASPGWQGMDFDTQEEWEKVKKLWGER